MKFTGKNNAVHLLRGDGPARVGILENSTELQAGLYFISHEFPRLREIFRKSIQYICTPFFEVYLRTKEKLTEAVMREPIQKSGTLIYPPLDGATLTAFYDVNTRHNGSEMIANGRIAIFANLDAVSFPQLVFYTRIADNQTITFQPVSFFREGFTDVANIDEVLRLLLFIKYCPVETKIIGKGQKVSHSHEVFYNKTDLPIEVLDSTWFTTLIRSEGFAVEGHFRLQPVGPGRSERRLTWIAPYEKKGYLRSAKILGVTDDASRQDENSSTI